jgi:tRNA A-37 threonylcarbamoyl transferase component Bud32
MAVRHDEDSPHLFPDSAVSVHPGERTAEPEFAIERELGRGGMGVVYLARDTRLDRAVAIKVLLSDSRASHRERFLREARMAAQLSHPHIVTVHRVMQSENQISIVTAFIEGETLAERIATRGPLDSRDAARVLREIAWALGYAHSRGIIHRDIKPENILLERGSGRSFVADFGIARQVDASTLTAIGSLVGSVHYMSPEQGGGEELDGRSDLYSLGVTGYYAVTGTLPITGPSAPAILVNHLTMSPRPVRELNDRVSPILAAAIERCLAKRADDRFASAEAFAAAIGPVVGQRLEIPPLVRAWVTRGELVLPILVLWMLPIALTPNAELQPIGRDTWGGPLTQRLIGLLIGGVPAVVAAFLLRVWDLRQLLRAGFSPDDVRFGVAAYALQRAEESAALRQRQSRGSRILRRLAVAVASVVSAGVFYSLLTRPAYSVVSEISGLLTGMLALMYAVVASGLWNKIREGRSRAWNGALGRFLFRVTR